MPLGQAGGGSAATSLIFLALMFVAFYLLLIRPQQKRMREQRSMQQSLQVGDEIRTIGGLQATIRRFDGDLVTIELSPGVEARIVKQAVSAKVTSSPPVEDEPAEEGALDTAREEREQQ